MSMDRIRRGRAVMLLAAALGLAVGVAAVAGAVGGTASGLAKASFVKVKCPNKVATGKKVTSAHLGRIKPGQKAAIHLDMYPGLTLDGAVESISAGSGATFSVLPPENATGNWVKVTQRFPIRIKITSAPNPDKPLRILVGFVPGGPADTIARVVGDKLTEAWGKPVVIENVTGSGGNMARPWRSSSRATGASGSSTATRVRSAASWSSWLCRQDRRFSE